MPSASSVRDDPIVAIEPPRPWGIVSLVELWNARELLYALTAREIQIRYAQTWVGVAWVVLKPLSSMLLLWAMFGRVAQLPTDGIPYPVFFFSGLVLWFFFAGAVTDCKDSVVDNADLVRKVYFPRLLLPLATVCARLLDLAITVVVLLFLVAYGQVSLSLSLVWIPVIAGLTALLAIGVGLWVAALNVRYRDTTHVVPVALQLLLFASPVVYSSHLVPLEWRAIYALNPLVGLIESFRAALVDRPIPLDLLAISTLVTVFLVASASLAFHRLEISFADTV